MKVSACVGILVTCVTISTMAQGTGPAPAPEGGRGGAMRMGFSPMDAEGMMLRNLMNDSKIVQDLGMTEDQVNQIKKLLADAQTEMQDNRTQTGELMKKQIDLLSQDTPDETEVMKVVDQLNDLRSELARHQMKQLLAIHKLLTSEQRTQLREMARSRMEQFRNARRDGRGPQEGARPQTPPPAANP